MIFYADFGVSIDYSRQEMKLKKQLFGASRSSCPQKMSYKSISGPNRADNSRSVRTENCGGEGDRHIHPQEDPKSYNEPGASGGVAVLLDA